MGAELQNSFKGVARGPEYCILTTSDKASQIKLLGVIKSIM